jgi:hypothetical protein
LILSERDWSHPLETQRLVRQLDSRQAVEEFNKGLTSLYNY